MLSPKEIFAAVKKYGSERSAATNLGIPRSTFQLWHQTARKEQFGAKSILTQEKVAKPKRGRVLRYIFSSAQDQTAVDASFLDNLEAYAQHLDAEIVIGGYTYNKSLFEDHTNNKAEFHERIKPYINNSQINVADKLMFCGEVNIIPTSQYPLRGFESYTRSMWGVFPHPRVCLDSIATMFNAPSKQIMTTGSVTKPNYIPKSTGFKAEFHHVVGALLVEVDSDGDIFCRHLIADKFGGFQDLNNKVENGEVQYAPHIEAITWGDIHFENIDPVVRAACWGDDGVLALLKPRYQFFHDTTDFNRRNHHNIKDPHHRFRMWRHGVDSVEADLAEIAGFLGSTSREGCTSVIVESNHDLAFARWLKEADYRTDPPNARFFLDRQKAVYDALQSGDETFSIFEDTMRSMGVHTAMFLRETDSFVICPKSGGGIECAIHGHKGANGAPGSLRTYAKMGPKANVAHTHSAGIYEGIYQAGTSSKLDLGYNRGGLSSWNHAHIVTYPNGKRIILTMQGKKWRV